MTIIRDINGNRVKKSLAHYVNNSANTGHYHVDSTGLWCVDYLDVHCDGFCAFIRPETNCEHNAVQLAKNLGTPRP